MKRAIQFHLILTILIFNLISCKTHNSANDKNISLNNRIDSIQMETDKLVQQYIKDHDLHKNNKDSAWINDFDGNKKWDSRANSKDGKALCMIDTMTNNYYILDSTHTVITAYNKSKQIIWRTDPHKDNHLPEYRHKNATITYFKIGQLQRNINEDFKKDMRVIFIRYDNSQFGFLD